jgi:hypothetical protein
LQGKSDEEEEEREVVAVVRGNNSLEVILFLYSLFPTQEL